MTTALELVYQYRLLVGKCESGAGLEFDEIDALATIEAFFSASHGDHDPNDLWACRRKFQREPLDLPGLIRNARLHDAVHVVDVGPGGAVCTGGAFVQTGAILELCIDDHELDLSYRFKARVTWTRDHDDRCTFGIAFVGDPLLVHYGPPSETRDRRPTTVDKIAA